MIILLLHLLRLLPFLCGGHRQLALENLALRQQLAVYKRTANRPKLQPRIDSFGSGCPECGPLGGRPSSSWLPPPCCAGSDTASPSLGHALRAPPPAGHPPVDPPIQPLVRKMAPANP